MMLSTTTVSSRSDITTYICGRLKTLTKSRNLPGARRLERMAPGTLGTSDRVLLFPRSTSDEKTAPVAAPPLGPFSKLTAEDWRA